MKRSRHLWYANITQMKGEFKDKQKTVRAIWLKVQVDVSHQLQCMQIVHGRTEAISGKILVRGICNIKIKSARLQVLQRCESSLIA